MGVVYGIGGWMPDIPGENIIEITPDPELLPEPELAPEPEPDLE